MIVAVAVGGPGCFQSSELAGEVLAAGPWLELGRGHAEFEPMPYEATAAGRREGAVPDAEVDPVELELFPHPRGAYGPLLGTRLHGVEREPISADATLQLPGSGELFGAMRPDERFRWERQSESWVSTRTHVLVPEEIGDIPTEPLILSVVVDAGDEGRFERRRRVILVSERAPGAAGAPER
jgi:hypothetical protein